MAHQLVSVACRTSRGEEAEPLLTAELITGETGFAEWTLDRRPEVDGRPFDGELFVLFRVPESSWEQQDGRIHWAADLRELPVGRLEVYPGPGRILGTVRDQNGQPVPGASVVRRWQPRARTDASGRFVVGTTPGRDKTRLVVVAAGQPLWNETITHAESGDTEVLITLPELRWVTGSVVDPLGQPVAHADVALDLIAYEGTPVQTDLEGRFRIPHSERDEFGGLTILRVTAPGLGGLLEDRTGSHVWEPWHIRLPGAAWVSGRVLTEDGEPVAKARIAPDGGADRVSGPGAVTRTDAQGRFTLRDVTATATHIQVQSEEFPLTSVPVALSAGQRLTDLEIRLDEGSWLAGRIVDAQGQGIPAIELYVLDMNAGSGTGLTRTAADGSFRMERLTATSPVLTVDPEDGFEGLSMELDALDQDLGDIALRSMVPLRGSVLDANGSPVTDFRIALRGEIGSRALSRWKDFRRVTSPDGRWETAGPVASLGDSLTVLVEAEGLSPGVLETIVFSDMPSLDIRLESDSRLRGWVAAADGSPMVGAIVRARPVVGNVPSRSEVETDGQGAFAFDGLAPTPHDVTVHDEGALVWRGEATPGDANLQVTLAERREIEVQTLGLDGEPSSLPVVLYEGDGSERVLLRGRSDAQGLWSCVAYSADVLRIEHDPDPTSGAIAVDYPPVQISSGQSQATLRPGGDASLILELDHRAGAMQWIDVSLHAVDVARPPIRFRTSGAEPFRIDGLAPGTWQLDASLSSSAALTRSYRHPERIVVAGAGTTRVSVTTGW